MFHSQFLKEVFADDNKLSETHQNKSQSQAGVTNSLILEQSVSIDLKGLKVVGKNERLRALNFGEDP